MKTSILIVDAQRMIREGIRRILESEPEFEVVADLADGREALKLAVEREVDVLIIDGQLPRMSGIEVVRRMRVERPLTACVVLSALQGSLQVREAVVAGAAAFVPKDSPSRDLVEAVRTVRLGRSYLAPAVADQIVSALRSGADGTKEPVGQLTPRQSEVLRLIAEGLSTKEVADELGISVKTAQTHRAKLMGRVGVRKASALVRYAIREGVVTA